MKKIFNNLLMSLLLIVMISIPIIFLGTAKNTVKAIENSQKQYIYIDPGHGGKDCGGISKTEIYEKDINLKISFILKTYLENSGYNVVLTRYGDYDLASPSNNKNRKNEDINKRLDLINQENTILYISIHCNIYTNNKIYGAQTFYNANNDESKELANLIQEKFKIILKNTDRNSKSITGKYLVDKALKCGCLVEVGFLSNENELNLLTTTSYQDKVAYCIYLGIIEYIGTNNNL